MLVVYFALSWSAASEVICSFFCANLILTAFFVLCVACEQALLGFSIKSHHRAPRRACLQAMLCAASVVADFVGLWCLLHVLLYSVGCMFSSS